MGGIRFAAAGLVLYVWARSKGDPTPNRGDLKSAAIIGALMVVLGERFGKPADPEKLRRLQRWFLPLVGVMLVLSLLRYYL